MSSERLEDLLEAHDKCCPLIVLHRSTYNNYKLVPDVTYTIRGNRCYPEDGGGKRGGKDYYVPSPLVSNPHAQIIRNKVSDTVWIKDLKSQGGTFINGKRVSMEFAEKVIEGDKITFGADFTVTLVKLESKVKRPKLADPRPEGDDEIEDPLSAAVFNNSLLIDRIFNFLPSLKNYRSINKTINTEISKKLGRNLKLKLEWGPNPKQMLEPNPEQDLATFNSKLSLMKKYNIGNFEIDIRSYQNEKDLRWFINTHAEHIKWLKVDLILTKATVKTAKSFFKHLKNCEEMELSLELYQKSVLKNLFTIQLPSVKKLSINHFVIKGNYQEFCNSFPNLVELNIPTDRHRIRRNACLKNEIFCKGKFDHFFPNLVSLTLGGGFSSEMMSVLVKFPTKLENLGLIGVEDLQALSDVLSAHAGSLKELRFEIWGDKGQGGRLYIPDMMGLKSLAIKIKHEDSAQGPILLKTGELPELRVLKADLGKNSKQNPFPLDFLCPFFPGILDVYSKFKFKKLRSAVIFGLDNSSRSKVNLFRKKHLTDFPKAAFIFDDEDLDLYKM